MREHPIQNNVHVIKRNVKGTDFMQDMARTFVVAIAAANFTLTSASHSKRSSISQSRRLQMKIEGVRPLLPCSQVTNEEIEPLRAR